MEMSWVSYSLPVESLMYTMISTRLNITQVGRVVSRFMTNILVESSEMLLRGSLNTSKELQVWHYVLEDPN